MMLELINYIGEITWIGALVNVVNQPGESPGIKSLNHRVPAKIFHYIYFQCNSVAFYMINILRLYIILSFELLL